MPCPFRSPSAKEETFKGVSLTCVEMDADIYYDEWGKDMRVEEIPADMMELAQEYRTKLIDACADLSDDHGVGLEEKPIPEDPDLQRCSGRAPTTTRLSL